MDYLAQRNTRVHVHPVEVVEGPTWMPWLCVVGVMVGGMACAAVGFVAALVMGSAY
jgi:hypothetical protein